MKNRSAFLLLIIFLITTSYSQFFNDKLQSAYALRKGTSAGIPSPWKQQDIGAVAVPGKTAYDGEKFTLQGSGTYTDKNTDRFHFAYFNMESEGEVTVRFVMHSGSKFSRMGLMMRESLAANSAQASLLLSTENSASAEVSAWQAVEFSRSGTGQSLLVKHTSETLTEPIVTNGLLTGLYWLRLQRKYNSFFAFTSVDGKTWTSLGSTFVEMKKNFYAGIAVSSGLKGVASTVIFDHVSIP